MERNELKSMWDDVQNSNRATDYDNISIEQSLTMNHCKVITKSLSDIKLKLLVWFLCLVIYTGLILYALVYLGLKLSFYSIIPLTLAGLFILFMTTSEMIRLLILTNSADNMSVKESLIFFKKKLNRIRVFDFLSNMFFFYLMIIILVINYVSDIGGIRNVLWKNGIIPVLLIVLLILLMLFIPWFIKYQHHRRYKNIFSGIDNAVRILDS